MAILRIYVSKEHITSIIGVKRVNELGKMLAVTSN
jgi:hypothetical protein